MGLEMLLKKFVFLAWGPIPAILTWFITKYSDELYAAVRMFIVVEAIAFRNKELHRKYNEASYRLKEAAEIFGIESAKFREVRDEDKKALSAFVRISA